MTRYVRNLDGAVHSVADYFALPDGWEEVAEGDASPQLLGTEPDPQVAAVELGPPVDIETGEPVTAPAETPTSDPTPPVETPAEAPAPDTPPAPDAAPTEAAPTVEGAPQ